MLGLTFLGETKVEKYVVGDIKVKGLIDVGFPLIFSSILTIYLKVVRNGICGETWEQQCECFVRLAMVLKEYSPPKKRTSIRSTETPGLLNLVVGGSKLENIDEISSWGHCERYELGKL